MALCHSARGREREGERESAREREDEKEIGLARVNGVWHCVVAREGERGRAREILQERRRERKRVVRSGWCS